MSGSFEYWFSVEDVARLRGVAPATVHKWVRRGLFVPEGSDGRGYVHRLAGADLRITARALAFFDFEHCPPVPPDRPAVFLPGLVNPIPARSVGELVRRMNG